MTAIVLDQGRKAELLKDAERLVTEHGPEGARRWLAAAGPVFPQAADVSLDFIKLLARAGLPGDADRLLRRLCAAHPLRIDLMEILGKWSRSAHPVIGAPVTGGAAPADPAESAYVTVAGNSYVRSFAAGTRFLPLMIGPGRATSFITPDCAAATRRMALANFARVDPKSLVLMVFGNGDILNHRRDDFGTWAAVETGRLPSHEAVMHEAMAKYCEMVAEIRRRYALNIVLVCAFPMLAPDLNPLLAAVNANIHAFGARMGIPVLDFTRELTDPATGCLRQELCTADGNDHISHELVPLVEQGLAAIGLLPRVNHAFAWDNMFRFAIDPKIETRIWSEPHIGAGNVLHSAKVMFTQILERAVHVALGALTLRPGRVLVINGREGFVALELPPALAAAVTSVDIDPTKALVGRRVARFAGRDIDFATRPLAEAAGAAECDHAFMVVHPEDDAAACMAALAALDGKARHGVFVLTALDWSDRLAALPGYSQVISITLANRLTTGAWAGTKLFALLR
jgi:hypothetical protein